MSIIGVFDSGVGGLSVLKEIQALLPFEDILYYADCANIPYGNKTPNFIVERSKIITRFLINAGAQSIVVACNTATAAAIKALREEWPQLAIVGMEPAVKPALAKTKTKVIGVLATVGTLKSAQFAALLDKFASDTEVVMQAAPGLVECVESGDLNSNETRQLLKSFVDPLLSKNADVIVLGCTHYPFLKKLISELAGPGVTLIDTGAAVAKQLQKKLGEYGLLSQSQEIGELTFYTSGQRAEVEKTISQLLQKTVIVSTVN